MNCKTCNTPYAAWELMGNKCPRCNYAELESIKQTGMRVVGSFMALDHGELFKDLEDAITELANKTFNQAPCKNTTQSDSPAPAKG